MRTLQGVGVSPGRVYGPVARMISSVVEPTERRSSHPEQEIEQVERAMQHVGNYLATLATQSTGVLTDVLDAQSLMALDPQLLANVHELIGTEHLAADRAVWVALNSFRAMLLNAGGYLAERAADVTDVRNRIITALGGVQRAEPPRPDHPFVLIADDLSPADTAALDLNLVLGFVTANGGPTSHTAILAKSLLIPAVVACEGILDVDEKCAVTLDGGSGEVIVNPSKSHLAAYPMSSPSRRKATTLDSAAGKTADGWQVQLLANVGTPEEARTAAEAGAQGVGLFRTEMLFLDKSKPPTVAEQRVQYREVFKHFRGKKFTVRTLDAGADKPLPFLGGHTEANPALGVRGIRLNRSHSTLLRAQLEAISAAASDADTDVSVMAPMVATVEDTQDFVASARAQGLSKVGVMIEVPSSVLVADHLFARLDFVSIGTNDLTQYTMAADRMVGELAHYNDYWQPAVIRLIDLTCRAAQRGNIIVSVCGESASDATYAALLIGLGVTGLSMTSSCLSQVNELIKTVTLGQCRSVAAAALEAATAKDARKSARRLLPQLPQLGL